MQQSNPVAKMADGPMCCSFHPEDGMGRALLALATIPEALLVRADRLTEE